MRFPDQYKVLKHQHFSFKEYAIAPIRYQDRFDIMKWRNEQIYHLRQTQPLTKETQEHYFQDTVANLFNDKKPEQLLFSYIKDSKCLGYGGLVHINWIDQNAEISFIMDTNLEALEFNLHWSNYLYLIEKVAFNELGLHKIYTYAFDLRPHLYNVLEDNNYRKEAELKEHCIFKNEFKSVLIHSKMNFKI